MCFYDDGDRANVHRVSFVKHGRKTYQCCACGHPIVAGAPQHVLTSLHEGQWWTFRAHEECHAINTHIQFGLCGQSFLVWALSYDGWLGSLVAEHRDEDPALGAVWFGVLRQRVREKLGGMWPK